MENLVEVLRRWRAAAEAAVPGLAIFDAHTHVGCHDPDGFTQSFDELVAMLGASGARGCFVFPFHEPDGYRRPNDAVREAALAQMGSGLLTVPFCRVNPWDGAVAEAERSLNLGARGIKLHPRAEAFELDHPVVAELYALADERGVPVLVHSGRGIAAPGRHLLELSTRFPRSRTILAHAGATDLSWLWRAAPDVPNLLFDTAWFMPADMLALFSLIPPAQILFASDAPYGNTLITALVQIRFASQVGMSADQIRLVFSGQSLAVARGAALAVAGPAVGEPAAVAPHVLLNRVGELIQMALVMIFRGGDGAELLALARLACAVPPSHDDAPVFSEILSLLDLHDEMLSGSPSGRGRLAPLMLAGCLARTPDVALPA